MLLLCNFGDREYLDLIGTTLPPAGAARERRRLVHRGLRHRRAAVSAQQLRRLALRPLLGLARAGSYGGEGSGEIGLAFTTDEDGRACPTPELSPYFAAAYEAAHEAVLNCLVAARPAERLDGTMQDAFPLDEVRRIARERAG